MYGVEGFDFTSADADAPESAVTVCRGNTCITPETETSCHYFTVPCHRVHVEEEPLNQDVDILARTQENIAYNPDADLVVIHVDEGVEKARQLARMAVRMEERA
ncbi:MAG: hypothetical protein F4Z55_14665 [Boseongicola sp. SB0667_bin_21]|nr:hypothetical protein [Boseongicola sp. SB0667_bin_21]